MINLSFSKLDSKLLFTLALRIKELFKGINADNLGIGLFLTRFLLCFEAYTKAMESENLKAFEIAQKDDVRDEMLIALRTHIKNYLHHPDKKLQLAAKAALAEIDKHGKQIYKQDYQTQTASIEGIIASFNKNYVEFIAESNSDIWFKFLVEAQDDFETTLRNYNMNKAEEADFESATEVRPELVKALRKLFAFLPMQYELTQNEELGKLIEQIKVEVERF